MSGRQKGGRGRKKAPSDSPNPSARGAVGRNRRRRRKPKEEVSSDSSDSNETTDSSADEAGFEATERKGDTARARRAAARRNRVAAPPKKRAPKKPKKAPKSTAQIVREIAAISLPRLRDPVQEAHNIKSILRINPSQTPTITSLSEDSLRKTYSDGQRFDLDMMSRIDALRLPRLLGQLGDAPNIAFLTIPQARVLSAEPAVIRRAMLDAAGQNDTHFYRALLLQLHQSRRQLSRTESAFASVYEIMALPYSRLKLSMFADLIKSPANREFLARVNRAKFAESFRSIVAAATENEAFGHFVGLDFTRGSWGRLNDLVEGIIKSDKPEVWFPFYALWKWSEGGYSKIAKVQSAPWEDIGDGKTENILTMLGAQIGAQILIDQGFTPAANDIDRTYSWEKGFPERIPGEIFPGDALSSTSIGPVTTYGYSAPTSPDFRWQACRVFYRPSRMAMIQPLGGKRYYWQREALSAGASLSLTLSREQLDVSTMGTVEVMIDGSLLSNVVVDRRIQNRPRALQIVPDGDEEARVLRMIMNREHLRAFDALQGADRPRALQFLANDVEGFAPARPPANWRNLYGIDVRANWLAAVNSGTSRDQVMSVDFVKALYGIIQQTRNTRFRDPTTTLQWGTVESGLTERQRLLMSQYHNLTVSHGVDTTTGGNLGKLRRWADQESETRRDLLATLPPGVRLKTRNGLLQAISKAERRDRDSMIIDLTELGWTHFQDYLTVTDTEEPVPETYSVYYAAVQQWGIQYNTFEMLIDDLLKSIAQRTDIQYRAYRSRVISEAHYIAWLQRTSAMMQQRLVAIHPYLDGNGRVSRALMANYLKLHLPIAYQIQWDRYLPDPRVSPDRDLTTTTDEWGELLFPGSRAPLAPQRMVEFYNSQRRRDQEALVEREEDALPAPALPVAFNLPDPTPASRPRMDADGLELKGGQA